MTRAESTWLASPSRRRAIRHMAGFVAGSPLFGTALGAQEPDPRPFSEHARTRGLNEMVTAFDFEPVMFANVPQTVSDYTAHGDGSEFTVRRNREAFGWAALVLGNRLDPASVDLSTEVLGLKMRYPIIVAPTALQGPLHPDGEPGMYRAATAASGTPFFLSGNTSTPVEKVGTAATGPFCCQFYPQQDRDTGRELLDRYQSAGSKAIIVTVDQQASYYERTQHDRNLGASTTPPRGRAAGPATVTGASRYRVSANRLWYTWKYLDEIRPLIKVPMLLKGIMTAEDARLALEHGVDGIIVSNHGGRSMDYGPSTFEVLPEIVEAVGERVPVITDSGYRRGADILKALALGAKAVMLGRATRWALGAFGPAGAQRLLEITQRELVAAAAMAGCPNIAAIDRRIIRTKFP